jgi:acetyl esterase/lipase
MHLFQWLIGLAVLTVLFLQVSQAADPAPAPVPTPPATTQPANPGAEPVIPPHTHIQDVIYGRKYGMCLTFDVFEPTNPNGAAVIALDTGGWVVDYDHIWAGNYIHYLERGYTVFQVSHGSAPKYSIPEQVADVRRAVKFIRGHAADYKIDPNRLGITGASAGGHLSVMMSVADTADPQSKDPVEKMSSRVQAVACFCPPTDMNGIRWPMGAADRPMLGAYTFLDMMEQPRDRILMGKGTNPLQSPGAVRVLTDADKAQAILKSISPIDLATKETVPTMVIQGELDKAVPVEKTQKYMAKLEELGIPHKLVIVPGAPHGVPNSVEWTKQLADWFDKYIPAAGKGK